MPKHKDITHDWKIHDFPWALLAFESPQFHKSNINFENYFIERALCNFTMTYRLVGSRGVNVNEQNDVQRRFCAFRFNVRSNFLKWCVLFVFNFTLFMNIFTKFEYNLLFCLITVPTILRLIGFYTKFRLSNQF